MLSPTWSLSSGASIVDLALGEEGEKYRGLGPGSGRSPQGKLAMYDSGGVLL